MGCNTSRAAFSAAAAAAASAAQPSSSRARRSDPTALCRERTALIRAAADRRFALAAAHAAYFRELAAVGSALGRFAASALSPATPSAGSSPVLTLPGSPVKGEAAAADTTGSLPPSPSSSSSTVSPLSHSLSDEALEAPPDAKQVGGIEKSPSKAASTSRHNYMTNSPTVPTVVYANPNADHAGGESSYGYGYTYPYPPYGEVVGEQRPDPAPRPTTPSPAAEVSPWEFFDPFTSHDQFLEDYSRKKSEIDGNLHGASPSYSELRRMEGIPELEDEAEVEAEASKPLKPSASGVASETVQTNEPVPIIPGSTGEVQGPSNAGAKGKKGSKSSAASSKDCDGGGISHGKKKAVAFEEDRPAIAAEGDEQSRSKSLSVASSELSPLHDGRRDVAEAMEEVRERFDEALNCSAEVSRLLEVGKEPYRTAPRVLRYFSSRVVDPLALHVPTSSCIPKPHSRRARSSSSKASTTTSSVTSRRNGNGSLSSTLEKLYVWEKKLYQEVKDEEKLRILYEKKYRKLKSLDEQGAEPNMIDSTQLSVRKLRSRISISIRIVNSISTTIHKIRDEELHPQLIDLIQGLRKMWKEVLECHEKQLLAIQDSKIHLLKAVTIGQSNVAAKATMDLECELAKWYRCFNKWVSSQRSYVEALNRWLKKWLPDEQEEETADGMPPFSPGRLGAPPAFVISNDWFQAIERISKGEVLRAMDHFAKLVHEFRKSQENEQRQKLKADHASRVHDRKRELLQRELGSSTNLDIVAVPGNTLQNHNDHVMELERMRKRRDDERTRHQEVVKHTHFTASATLPAGLIPTLQEVVNFFQRNLQVYMGIRIAGT